MLSAEQTRKLRANSEEIVSEDAMRGSLDRMAEEIIEKIGDTFPMVLSVMGGTAVFTGMPLPKLAFPLEFDYIHLSRYNNTTMGGEMQWCVVLYESVKGHTVLVLDNILGEDETMAAIRSRIIDMGAAEFYSAVLCGKTFTESKLLYPDLCGFNVPDRYVFSCGMDAKGYWHDLPTIRTLKNT